MRDKSIFRPSWNNKKEKIQNKKMTLSRKQLRISENNWRRAGLLHATLTKNTVMVSNV